MDSEVSENCLLRFTPYIKNYIIECTPFADHLQSDFQHITEMFGEPSLHDLAQYCPQQRKRYCWTSLPSVTKIYHLPGLPLTWQDCLQDGALPPTDALQKLMQKCPTIMASSHSHSDRARTTWVYDLNGTHRALSISEKEQLVGLNIGDTAAAGVSETARHRFCGNAFPVAWIAHLLDSFLIRHTGTLRPLASRSLAQTVCVHQPSRSMLSALTNPNSTSYLQRLKSAATADPEYHTLLQNTPSHLKASNGLLFQSCMPNEQKTYHGPAVVLVLADNALRQDLLHLVHDQSHFGVNRTYDAASRHFTWKGMKTHVRNFVAQCPTCQLQKPGNTSRHQPLFPETRFYPYPFHTVVLDVVEGLPLSAGGYNGVLTIVDRFTKFAIYVPIHTSWSAFRQAQCILDALVYRYHTPQRIHTDNGPAYRKLFRALCAALGVRHTTGTPYHSQSQGGAERQHRTLLQQLRVTCDDRRHWEDYLQAAAHAYNDSVHAVTRVAPFVALYGCPSRLPWHLQIVSLQENTVSHTVTSYDDQITALLDKQRHVYKQILQNLQTQADNMMALRPNQSYRTFKVGDQVKVQYGLKGPTDKHKLDPYYVGPFTIIQDLGTGAYKLQIPSQSKYSDRFNADRLAPWIDSDLTLFPNQEHSEKSIELPPDSSIETTCTIDRYLLRDYHLFPQQPVRYWVQIRSTATPYMWVEESSELLDEFLPLEENNGCIPEQGIGKHNYEAVKQHKLQVYLQHPSPIMVNTWTSSQLPFQTRRRPTFKPPANLLHAVVQQLFQISGKPNYYQGIVVSSTKTTCCIRWTDGQIYHYTPAEVRSMLYDPISYIYDFLRQ